MLILAREFNGLTQSQLALQLGVSQALYSRIEAGLTAPSAEVMGQLSEAMRLPVEFFEQTEPLLGAETSVLFHRKSMSVPVKTLRRLHATVNLRRMQISRLLQSAEIETGLEFPYLDPVEFGGTIDELAAAVRASWRIGSGPIENMVDVVERAGGIIVQLDVGTRKIDGLSQPVPGLPPHFFMNKAAPPDRARFSLAHEVGHVVMHRMPTPASEDEANAFAAAFLMPGSEIRDDLHNLTLPKLFDLKRYWKVSMAALLHRAETTKAISARRAKSLWIELGVNGLRREEPVESQPPAEVPQLLSQLVAYHLKDLGYSVSEFAQLLLTSTEDAAQFFTDRPALRVV